MTEKLQNALNEQITAELWSANLYLSMSFYLEREGFSGMARWMQKQSAEETGHAYAIAGYMIKREATPKVDKVDVVPQGWGNPVEVFEHALEHEKHVSKHECHVSELIDNLVNVASEVKDKASQDFLWGFVREQVEDEANVLNIVSHLRKAGDCAILFMDAKLGERES